MSVNNETPLKSGQNGQKIVNLTLMVVKSSQFDPKCG